MEGGHLDEPMLIRQVVGFIRHQLSAGGTSYWSPLIQPRLELNDTAMSFLLGQSTVFEELRQVIADAFEPPVVDSFVKSLSLSDIRMDNFEAVLPELSNMLGGAYGRGTTFSTSTNELFQKLKRTEQELLRKYFYGRVKRLSTDPQFAALRRACPNVFGN